MRVFNAFVSASSKKSSYCRLLFTDVADNGKAKNGFWDFERSQGTVVKNFNATRKAGKERPVGSKGILFSVPAVRSVPPLVNFLKLEEGKNSGAKWQKIYKTLENK